MAGALEQAAGELQLFFAGGGGQALQASLQRGGDYRPDLVFEGLEIMAALDA